MFEKNIDLKKGFLENTCILLSVYYTLLHVLFPVISLFSPIVMSKKVLFWHYNPITIGTLKYINFLQINYSEGLRANTTKNIIFYSIVFKKTIKFKIYQIYWDKSTKQLHERKTWIISDYIVTKILFHVLLY